MEASMRPIDDSSFSPPLPMRPPPPVQSHEPEELSSTPLNDMEYPEPRYFPMYNQDTVKETVDIFENLTKTTMIIIFVAFILGLFMGKTMQPVILKNL